MCYAVGKWVIGIFDDILNKIVVFNRNKWQIN